MFFMLPELFFLFFYKSKSPGLVAGDIYGKDIGD